MEQVYKIRVELDVRSDEGSVAEAIAKVKCRLDGDGVTILRCDPHWLRRWNHSVLTKVERILLKARELEDEWNPSESLRTILKAIESDPDLREHDVEVIALIDVFAESLEEAIERATFKIADIGSTVFSVEIDESKEE